MSEQKDGGAAFPHTGWRSPDGMKVDMRQVGMTLRDYFAGQALVGMGTWMPGPATMLGGETAMLERAKWAYKQADAMIKAREA